MSLSQAPLVATGSSVSLLAFPWACSGATRLKVVGIGPGQGLEATEKEPVSWIPASMAKIRAESRVKPGPCWRMHQLPQTRRRPAYAGSPTRGPARFWGRLSAEESRAGV